MPRIVTKFGGTSVRDKQSWHTIATLIKQAIDNDEVPLVVCSALPGISDALEQLLMLAAGNQHQTALQQLIARYVAFGESLKIPVDTLLKNDIQQLTQLIEGIALTGEVTPTLHARVLAFGELMLTRCGAQFLKQQGIDCLWLDAREHLQSLDEPVACPENQILNARVDETIDTHLQNTLGSHVIITQGFIARNTAGQTVLLGRGGSDTSAALFAAKCQAIRCEIWTDVPGIYTTNPHWVPEARLLKSLNYEEALEIAAAGANVLHPKCIGPLMRANIDCHIRCTHEPQRQSTVISSKIPFAEPHVKAIAKRSAVTLVVMESTGMWQQVGFLADVFQCFKTQGIAVDLIATSEKNVTVSIDTSAVVTESMLTQLCTDLSRYCNAKVITGAASISLVGRKIRAILHQLAPIFERFAEHKMYMLTQAANDLNLTVVIDDEHATAMIQKLHAALFEKHHQLGFLGDTWAARTQTPVPALDTWWAGQHDTLLAHMQTQDALYVYDTQTVQHQCRQLLALNAVDTCFYAVKANPHPDILRAIGQEGLGFECVSLGEIDSVKAVFPDIIPERILFTPNFAPLSEYERAFEQGVYVTLDNCEPLLAQPALFAKQSIILRVDPGVGRGHHQYVKTGGSQSKFGITLDELHRIKPHLKQYDIRIIGLHAHAGSGVLTADNWASVATLLIAQASDFPDVRIINVGGGLGVPERFGEPRLALDAVNASLHAIKQMHPQYALWMEPGRFVVAEAGVLLARVTQTKQKQHIHYVGVATGMNSLIRPALYGAYHEIVNLTRLAAPRTLTAHVVGPICESGDTLGYDRLLPETHVGDVLLVANAGAYGHAMSSHYNAREPARECLL